MHANAHILAMDKPGLLIAAAVVLRRPAYGQEQCGGLTPAGAAKILNADARARKSLTGNGNLRLNVAVLAGEIA